MTSRDGSPRSALQHGWVIANHILVSFHVAFISSVLALPAESLAKGEVLQFIFLSHETLLSALFVYLTFHAGIALHEMGHLLAAVRLNALNEAALKQTRQGMARGELGYLIKLFLLIPFGKAVGVKKEGLNYYADAPFNLAVAAAGPRMSRNVAWALLPPAAILITIGLLLASPIPLYVGRLLLGIGVVAFLDFRLADPGKYRAFVEREQAAKEKAETVEELSGWYAAAQKVKQGMIDQPMQTVNHPRFGPVSAPWQFRNCGMGGRHTEKEYPESNISMQEGMFLIIGARDYLEGQEMTVRLQTRLKEIIESEEGCRVMGIGLEGGLAPYIDRGEYRLPELRLWAMMKRAIEECGYRPGIDVAIALDPAASELEIAYREENEMPDAVGMYLFWRDKSKIEMDYEGILEVYLEAINKYEIPILSIEDGFAEDDFKGWQLLLERAGDRILVIGDDLVTTNDRTIEQAAGGGMINAALIKANQIGTLFETLLAMLVALGKGMQLVVSHRSKSPNDDMEAQIALAVNSLGLKAGGGSNTERLVKYQSVVEQMLRVSSASGAHAMADGEQAKVARLLAYEEPTNAGIPTVGVTVELALRDAGVQLRFRGATPLGTSAGTGEAIHLVDKVIERAEHQEVIDQYSALFKQVEAGVYSFKKEVDPEQIEAAGDPTLSSLYRRSQRYNGKGCLTAVDNALEIIAPHFVDRDAATMTLRDIDGGLLRLELATAKRRGKQIGDGPDDQIALMQRKQNLGMNAMLSVSLAMARAVAHVQGRELYELLREEMIRIIEQLATSRGKTISGTTLADYIAVLREVTKDLEAEDLPLHEQLRNLTAIYGAETATATVEPLAVPLVEAQESVAPQPVEPEPEEHLAPAPKVVVSEDATQPLQGPEAAQLDAVSEAFFAAFAKAGARDQDRVNSLRIYLQAKHELADRLGSFGVVNNRLMHGEGVLVAAYLVDSNVIVYLVREGSCEQVAWRRFAPGTIFTDKMICELANGVDAPQIVDIEAQLMVVQSAGGKDFRIARVGDIAKVLGRVNEGVNRNEAVFLLRHLVARLCNISAAAFVRAKNLQPEINLVVSELVRLTNSSLGRRLPLLMRILVRNLPILIGKPNLIDRLWNDTIALAEVHVRGSAIVNELRRTSHHALGPRTLRIARAYHAYLETGQDWGLRELGFNEPSQSDIDARQRSEPRQILSRVITDVEGLLGRSETPARLRDWQNSYVDAYVRCPYGNRLDEELEVLIKKGIRPRSRWAYLHHLRILEQKATELDPEMPAVIAFREELAALQAQPPDADDFDIEETAKRVSAAVASLIDGLQDSCEALFDDLDELLGAHEHGDHDSVYERVCAIRERVAEMMKRPAFTAQRYYLTQVDCLLEEMGYLAVRHIAARQEEKGVDLKVCLKLLRACVLNLIHDGIYSQELCDLSAMLVRDRGSNELLDILAHIQRCYHKIRQRVTVPFERMQARMELDDEELRAILANMQRYMHDLNSMVQLANIAEAHVRKSARTKPQPKSTPSNGGLDAIIHISHREQIAQSVGTRANGPILRELYGGKGSGLLYISHQRIPTRDGFILPSSAARCELQGTNREPLQRALVEHLEILQKDIARCSKRAVRFGDPKNPLLIAVRGGSVFSMPGILSTVVFVGMNDAVAEGLAADGGWAAYDSYRRFLASYGSVVWGLDVEGYNVVDRTKERYNVEAKKDLPWEAMREIAEETKQLIRKDGYGDQLDEILNDPLKQLFGAAQSVMDSWNSPTAKRYREIKGLCDDWCTSVIVQEMAFGNRTNEAIEPGMDETTASLTGVIPRTRETNIGTRALTGEIKFSAAGDDLVGGAVASFRPLDELDELMPMLKRRLRHTVAKIRRLMGTDQEIEFTVDRGVLSVLQARTAATQAETEQISFIDPGEPTTQGLGVCGSGFRGLAAFSEEDREQLAAVDLSKRDDVDGTLMILENPTPEDIPVIISADGLLTAKGGSTSHAAVAANQIEDRTFSAVMSVVSLKVNPKTQEAQIVDDDGNVQHRIRRGDVVSIHGTSGEVYIGSRRIDQPAAVSSRRP